MRFYSTRLASGSPQTVAGHVAKRVNDKLLVQMNYDDALDDGDYISTCTLTAVALSDRSTDVASTILDNTGGPPKNADLVGATADSGSTTSLVDTSENNATKGVLAGDKLVNVTRGWTAVIKSLSKGTNPFDTMNFDAQASAVQAGDTYQVRLAGARIKAGTSGAGYLLTFKMTSAAGRVIEDVVVIQVAD